MTCEAIMPTLWFAPLYASLGLLVYNALLSLSHTLVSSIAPCAILCSSDLVHLGNSQLELFVLAFLVAVSFIL